MSAINTSKQLSGQMKLAMCQILVGLDKKANLTAARKAIREAAISGAHLVSLPECFNSPYSTASFEEYAEPIPSTAEEIQENESPSTAMLIDAAKEHGIFLIGGSIPEKEHGKIYNTSVVVNPKGDLVCKHRKMHLFDIDVPGGVRFFESDTLSPGNQVTTFDTPYCKVGLAICYDMRFPQLAMLMRDMGCKLLVYPGAFNTTTGPPHWELLQRGRAVDNQVYVATASPARNPDSTYQAWGHSSIISPWGDVLATTGHDPDIVYADIDIEKVDKLRTSIPVSKQWRHDIYKPVTLVEKE